MLMINKIRVLYAVQKPSLSIKLLVIQIPVLIYEDSKAEMTKGIIVTKKRSNMIKVKVTPWQRLTIQTYLRFYIEFCLLTKARKYLTN